MRPKSPSPHWNHNEAVVRLPLATDLKFQYLFSLYYQILMFFILKSSKIFRRILFMQKWSYVGFMTHDIGDRH